MHIMFAGMHGSACLEMALLCSGAGIKISMPTINNKIVETLVSSKEEKWLKELDVLIISSKEEMQDKITDNVFDAVIISSWKQIIDFNLNIKPLNNRLPYVIRHGINSFNKFKQEKVKNFLSPSAKALKIMDECNGFLTRKLIPWEWPEFRHDKICADMREGFFQYIHCYNKIWPEAEKRFENLREVCKPISIKNYGEGSRDGIVDDLKSMRQSRATIHIKDGQVVCNAVIRSMALSTPVLMDRTTYNNCFFDQIHDINVFDDVMDMANVIRQLNSDDDLLEEYCQKTYISAKKQFGYDDYLGERFKDFLMNLRN